MDVPMGRDSLCKVGAWERSCLWAGDRDKSHKAARCHSSVFSPRVVSGQGMLREEHEMMIKWVSLLHNSWVETNLCTRQDHPLNFSSMDHCSLTPRKIHLTPYCLSGSSTSLFHIILKQYTDLSFSGKWAIWTTEPNQSLLLLLRMPAEKLITTSSSRVGSLSARDQDETPIHSPIYYVQGLTRLTLVSTDLQKLFNRPGSKETLIEGRGELPTAS